MAGAAKFEIELDKLTATQLHQIMEHVRCGEDFDIDFLADGGRAWSVKQEDDKLVGRCLMETWQMWHYLKEIGIDSKNIRWTRYYVLGKRRQNVDGKK